MVFMIIISEVDWNLGKKVFSDPTFWIPDRGKVNMQFEFRRIMVQERSRRKFAA
jgi:hypothetical protein